jgi:hypothetical protein
MRSPRFTLVVLCILGMLGVCCAPASGSALERPGWQLWANSYPTHLVPHGVNEVQEVVTAGQPFTLTFEAQTTAPVPSGAEASAVQAALEALPNIGAGNVVVIKEAGGGYAVTFVGPLGNMKVASLEADGAEASVRTLGAASGTIAIDVFNVGAADSNGPITVTDRLPAGLKAKEAGELYRPSHTYYIEGFGVDPLIHHEMWNCTGNGPDAAPKVAGATVVTCTNNPATLGGFAGGGGSPTLNAEEAYYPQPVVGILVEASGEAANLTNFASISGGGAAESASTEEPVTVSTQPARGLASADAWFSNTDGTSDSQAGSHPYLATFAYEDAVALNAADEAYLLGGEMRNLEVRVPSGFVGDLSDMPQCQESELLGEQCPPGSMVGTLAVSTFVTPLEKQVFNMIPPPGSPAELGFTLEGTVVHLLFRVQTGSDYAIVTNVNDIPQREVYGSILTLWGVPEEESHDRWRGGGGSGCPREEIEHPYFGAEVNYCAKPQKEAARPFLTLPTSCGEPQPFDFKELNSWSEPNLTSGVSFLSHDANDQPVGFTGCDALAFEPSLTVATDTAKADTPTGLTVEVHAPVGGLVAPGALGTSDIKDTTVALPVGLVINPGQAAGLQACGPAEDGLTTEAEEREGKENSGPPSCPNASKIGTVRIQTPLIEGAAEKQFEGDVYVLQSNPPELRLLVAASADGVNLKLVGKVSLCEAQGEVLDGKTCEAPGQLITVFDGTPELPFTVFKLSFSGGAQAALDTPVQCGNYMTHADFTPWATPFVSDALSESGFTLSEGPDGSACPSNPLPFAPTLIAGATTDQAGGYTGFSMLLRRGDGQQRMEKLSFTAPSGLSGMLSSVPLCGEPQAAQGTCPAASHIGHATVTSGPGPYPLVIPQPGEPEAPIYLTGPYDGAPFGLSIVTPVIAGPFNLGTIVTRAKIEVDRHTAQITVTTAPLPQIVKGVPTDLREVDAVIDRPGFMFNPTNCSPYQFSGTATSSQGTTVPIASSFQVGSCRSLTFAPKFEASTGARTSRSDGASLTAKVAYPAGAQGAQANIARVKVELPKQLPSRLSTLQKACTAAQFQANPAGCPAASVIGHAIVHTALLPVPLTGPVYFVSHGGESFPSLTILLQGDGVTVELVGATFISKKGITSTTFKTVPDVPFTTFELSLPQGPYSALTAILPAKAHGSLCGQKLVMPTSFVAQNGLELHQNTAITPTGCGKARKASKRAHPKSSRRARRRNRNH